ncbi:MAG: response regulator transcription factor [Candidatus Hydrogenedentes bacterium]|nr:response regulator transcription factor [Candidatus Hydrogenedentota bacterium]
MKIRVLLADDHKLMRDGLSSLLQKEPRVEVVGVAESGRSAVQLAKELQPDVMVMDVAMPDLNGVEAARRIRMENPNVRVLALSMHDDKRFVARMLQAGASGYLLKDCACGELVRAIETVHRKQVYLSESITTLVTDEYKRQLTTTGASPEVILSPKEREVLQLLSEGKSTKQIAAKLHVSVKTIETHRTQIMEKLDLHSVAELTKYAVREGITSL